MSENEAEIKVQDFISYVRFNEQPKYTEKDWLLAIETILDLYQQEKEQRQKFEKAFKQRMEYSHELEKDLFENCSNYVISKDKIRAKIEELEDECDNSNAYDTTWYEASINALKELLEEE